MKIDNSAKTIGPIPAASGPRVAATRAPATSAAAASPATGQSATVVSVALSSVAGSEAAFNAGKVEEIQRAISEGKFQINPERIADGLINSVREMLSQNRRPA